MRCRIGISRIVKTAQFIHVLHCGSGGEDGIRELFGFSFLILCFIKLFTQSLGSVPAVFTEFLFEGSTAVLFFLLILRRDTSGFSCRSLFFVFCVYLFLNRLVYLVHGKHTGHIPVAVEIAVDKMLVIDQRNVIGGSLIGSVCDASAALYSLCDG